jgi:hypothetical protein
MKRSSLPANVTILDTRSPRVAQLREVTSLDITVAATRNLHPEGLFSTQIFGRVGSDERDTTFGRIKIAVPVFDPTTFDILMSLKGLYPAIINETKFAVWDEVERDFVASDPLKGDTGYDFFFRHWNKIQFAKSNSDRRNIKIQMLEKYKDEATLQSFVVLPAGLRDIETNEAGRLEENEVNELYRRVLSSARVLNIGVTTGDLRSLNAPRRSLQRAIQEVWQYFFDFIGGKRGYMAQRMASRRIFDGTRNVITAMDPIRAEIGMGEALDINKTQAGIFQTAKGTRPMTIGILRKVLMEHVFEDTPESTHAWLINPKTFERVHVNVGFQIKDRWTTKDGLGKVIESFREDSLRQSALQINGMYLGLIYEKDGAYKMFYDIAELPEGLSRHNVRPITLTDFLYLNCVERWLQCYLIPTRYPVAGAGSIYPSQIALVSTVPATQARRLDENWEAGPNSFVVNSYPLRNAVYFDSMSVHPAMLVGLGADHDGDMASGNIVMADESIKELDNLMDQATTYLNPQGGLKSSMDYYTTALVTHNMSLR